MVPPAVMRRDVQVGGKCFALGTIIHFVPNVRTLTCLGPQVVAFYVKIVLLAINMVLKNSNNGFISLFIINV